MEIKLIILVILYLMILSYNTFKKNFQEIILDLLKIIMIPIGLIWKLLQQFMRKI